LGSLCCFWHLVRWFIVAQRGEKSCVKGDRRNVRLIHPVSDNTELIDQREPLTYNLDYTS